MYEAFYGFKEKPFSMLPDPGFLFLSKKHQTALTLLEYGLLNHVGFCVISGEPGAGKTTIIRALLDRIGDEVTVGLITNTHQSFGGLLDWVLSAFDLHRPNLTHVEMHQIFMEFLIEEYSKGRTTLLIVDEAQNLQPDALEELRMLTNVNSEKDQLMQVVLAGQPALKEMLRLPDLMQFAQRIAVDYHLDPLSLEETCGYIQHRLVTAGAQKDVFTPAACERIYNYSGGTPRLINLLCETVLVYGFADQLEMIDVDLVDEMVLERMKDSVVPIVNRDVANQDNSEASKALEKNFPWIRPLDGSTNSTTEADTISRVADSVEESVTPAIVDVASAEVVEAEQSVNEKPEDDARHETKPEKQASEEASPSPVGSVASKSTSATSSPVRQDNSNINQGDTDNRRQLIKYGVIAVMLMAALVVLALVLDVDEAGTETEVVKDLETEDTVQRQRELEEQKFRQLQIEAETLKKERDAAIARAEAEKLANLEAAKKAAAAAALAAEEAAEKIRLEELQRVEAAKQREREAKAAEARAKRAAESARLEAEKLAEQQRVMSIRLEEEAQLKKLEEARRKELEAQRLEALAAEEQAVQAAETAAAQAAEVAAEEAALKAAEEARSKPADCTGPTARFKSGCR